METKRQEIPDSPGHADIRFFQEHYRTSTDVVLQAHRYGVGHAEGRSIDVLLIYCKGMVDQRLFQEYVQTKLALLHQHPDVESEDELQHITTLPVAKMKDDRDWLALLSRFVFSGHLILFVPSLHALFTLDISQIPGRKPESSALEPSLKGPRDCLTEDLNVNMALIRKRLRTQTLAIEQTVSGKRGQNRIALLYIEDVINPSILEEMRRRISELDQDAVIGTSMIEHLVVGKKIKSFFPPFDTTGRPDYLVSSLLNGRFAIMCDGSPMATIAPITMYNLIKSPEDENMPMHIVAFQRVLRYIGLIIALFLPGFYVGLTSFNLEQVPLPLLATIANTRQGLPLPVTLEALVMLFMFDLFTEAGRRLPESIGQTVTVVGGLIIGDASIRAGITSPTVIVMIAVSIIATYTLIDPILSGTVSQVRILILLVSSLLGLYGFMIAFLLLVLHLSSLNYFGVPYMSPVSPFNKQDIAQGILMKSSLSRNKRPDVLNTRDSTSGKGGNSE